MLFIEPEAVPVHARSPVPVPLTCMLPVGVAQATGSITVPSEITGVVFTVTIIGADVEEQPLMSVKVTEYVPEVVTEIDWVTAPPGDQALPVAAEDVSVTLPPEQKVVGPPAEIVGAAGALGSFRPCVTVLEVHPEPFVNDTL
jgi:hypothetical protein